uniref:ATP synthase F0 subunit 8 n=1 Tax=Crangonyx forbesi TaxID=111557 RepID=A0A6C0X5A6_9CRUS|nr:ATP synthase F0 subunit 8 [Crangonyx forbesi]
MPQLSPTLWVPLMALILSALILIKIKIYFMPKPAQMLLKNKMNLMNSYLWSF